VTVGDEDCIHLQPEAYSVQAPIAEPIETPVVVDEIIPNIVGDRYGAIDIEDLLSD